MDKMTCESSGISLSRSMAQKMIISTMIANPNSTVATIRLACGCGMSDPSVGKLASSIFYISIYLERERERDESRTLGFG